MTNKKSKLKGAGFIDDVLSINKKLKQHKFANKLLEYAPGLGTVPYLGKFLKTAKIFGYGKHRKKKL